MRNYRLWTHTLKRAVSNPIMSNDTALFLVLREVKVSNQEVRILSDVGLVSNIFYGNYLSSCNIYGAPEVFTFIFS